MWIFLGALLCAIWGMIFGDLKYNDRGMYIGAIVGIIVGAIIGAIIEF